MGVTFCVFFLTSIFPRRMVETKAMQSDATSPRNIEPAQLLALLVSLLSALSGVCKLLLDNGKGTAKTSGCVIGAGRAAGFFQRQPVTTAGRLGVLRERAVFRASLTPAASRY
jgi:hypothetical protein